MKDGPSTSDQWDSCPPGELQKLAAQLRRKRRGRNVATAVGLAAALIVFLLVGGFAVQQLRDPHDNPQLYGDITCREVQSHLQQYVAGQLDPPLAERIRIHLEQCPECGENFRRMMAEIKQEVTFLPVPVLKPACTRGDGEQPLLAAEPHFPRLALDGGLGVLLTVNLYRL
ncbi:MAG: zf-HC2 domain-containing protein [Candidatus Paceibacterota bacterium]